MAERTRTSDAGEWQAAVQGTGRFGQSIEGTRPLGSRDGGEGRSGGLTMAGGFGQPVLLGLETLVLPGVLDVRPLDLVDLVAQQVDLARPLPGVAAEGLRLVDEPAELEPGGGIVGQIDLPEDVEGPPLGIGADQRLMLVLAMQLDQHPGRLGQGPDGGHPAVDPGPGPAGARHRTGQDDLGSLGGVGTSARWIAAGVLGGCGTERTVTGGDDEPALDHRLVGAGPDDGGIGSGPEQQAQGLHQQRLARAGLPGEGGHPRPEAHRDVVDHPEVAHTELDQLRSQRSHR